MDPNQASMDRFAAIGRATGSMLWTADPTGMSGSMPGWNLMTGQPVEATANNGWLKQVHPEDRLDTARLWSDSIQKQTPYRAKFRVRLLGGDYRWFKAQGAPVLNMDGTVREWVGVCVDIDNNVLTETQMQLAEAALTESERRYRQTFDNAAVGIAHVGLDGTWLQFNDALCQIVGYPRDELLNRTFGAITHPDDLPNNWNTALKIAKGDLSTATFEKRYHHKLGHYVWVNVTTSLSRHEDGRPKHFISIIEDIDAKKRAEQAVSESEDHYRFMVDSNPQMPWTADKDGNMTDFSDRWLAMIGMTRAQTKDGGWLKAIHPEDVHRITEDWSRSVSFGHVYDVEHRAQTSDGSYRWMRTRAVPRRNPDGAIVRWYGSTEDIDRQKQIETNLEIAVGERTAELNQANAALIEARDAALSAVRAKSEFLANMSHEVRTPLNGVIGLASLLRETPLDEKAKEMVETIAASSTTLLRVIDDILDISRLEASKLEIEPTRVDLDLLCSDTVGLFQEHATAKNLKLTCVAPDTKPPRVLADPIRLRQILSNLISNGLKFTEHGEVVLRWKWDYDVHAISVQFSVTDTGPGIPEDQRKTIFESFTQADGSIQRKFGGSGLGLTIAQGLVDLMGGTLLLQTVEGTGSTFSVSINFELAPVWTEEASVAAVSEQSAQEKVIRVLLAEDNPINTYVASSLLEHCGCEVEVAENGLRAIYMTSTTSFDLVLMDVQMPICDGLEATRIIRMVEERDGRERLPILALTANVISGDREACMIAGMDGFISKPIALSELQSVVKSVRSTMANRHSNLN